MNLSLVCVLWVCMLGRGVCWFFLPCVDVSVVCWPTGIWCIVYLFLLYPVAYPGIQFLLV
jgi:hypothetical protein